MVQSSVAKVMDLFRSKNCGGGHTCSSGDWLLQGVTFSDIYSLAILVSNSDQSSCIKFGIKFGQTIVSIASRSGLSAIVQCSKASVGDGEQRIRGISKVP